MAVALYDRCGQYYPYAGKTSSCGGMVRRVQILWNKAEGYTVDKVNPEDGGLVCDDHMLQFVELGRRDEFQYEVVSDEVVGSIGACEIETGGPKEHDQL